MTADTPVCVICLESDENKALIVLHESFEHYLHAGCYPKLTQKMTCPFCTRPFSSQQSRELLDKELRDVFDKQQALAKNLQDKNYVAIKNCVFDTRTEKYAIIDAFSLKYDEMSLMDSEKTSRFEVFLICAVACEDPALIGLALTWFSSYLDGRTSSYNVALEASVKLRRFKSLEYLAAHDIKPGSHISIDLIFKCCKQNDMETVKNLLKVFPHITELLAPHIFSEATTDEMAYFLLTAWSETIFNNENMWKNIDFECFLLKCSNEVMPVVGAWERVRAEGYKGKFLPPPYDFQEYRKKFRFK